MGYMVLCACFPLKYLTDVSGLPIVFTVRTVPFNGCELQRRTIRYKYAALRESPQATVKLHSLNVSLVGDLQTAT